MSPRKVYDFLYVDVKRIARLVAQLDGEGILQETTREFTASGDIGTKLNLGFWEVTLSPKANRSKGSRYDPSWRLPVVFLDKMHHHIAPDPKTWELGQIVTLTGSIAFHDFAFAAEFLSVEVVRKAMKHSAEPASVITDEQSNQFRNAVEALPHLLLTSITNGTVTTWSTVNDALTTASTGDLILKCGEEIEGEWTITGILDAIAEQPDKRAPTSGLGGFSEEFDQFGKAVRTAIGRPANCYGITPLTIHRKVEVPKFSEDAD